MVGILIFGGTTAYLLPGFAGGRRATEDYFSGMMNAHSVPSEASAGDPVPFTWLLSPAGRWQGLPLLALQNSADVAEVGELKIASLQTAFERERDRAGAAQIQIATLQEQLARQKEKYEEKQEEVIILREQLTDSKANALQRAEHQSEAIEEKEQTDNALLREAASHVELAKLRASLIDAQNAAESERKKALSAYEQLEAAQGRLAALITLEGNRADTESQLRPKEEQVVAPLYENRKELLPATRIFQLPLPLTAYPAPSDRQENEAEPDTLQAINPSATDRNARQASLPPRARAPVERDNNAEAAAIRSHRLRVGSDARRLVKRGDVSREQAAQSIDKASPSPSQGPRLLVEDVQNSRSPGVLRLPGALLPDNRLW
ncbi:hypothetical protein AA309_01830 [Microvirga vignae]|uniref:Uncharacterized protein n=1 Tax=Microvirga vignae TaxID=1225564 RepID=A0A0H1RI27_9HYPH|nr:hypothetical protein [Microvirga vignae]KLK94729.1 hypothetical protein AA309_01830 [Microvirga vignae]